MGRNFAWSSRPFVLAKFRLSLAATCRLCRTINFEIAPLSNLNTLRAFCRWVTSTIIVCGQQTALEIGGHPEAGRSANTNCYWRQRFRCFLCCRLELATYRSASLVTVCGDVCQTPESLLVSSPELAHLRTVYFALYKCTHYYYY